MNMMSKHKHSYLFSAQILQDSYKDGDKGSLLCVFYFSYLSKVTDMYYVGQKYSETGTWKGCLLVSFDRLMLVNKRHPGIQSTFARDVDS